MICILGFLLDFQLSTFDKTILFLNHEHAIITGSFGVRLRIGSQKQLWEPRIECWELCLLYVI
jgi:hypothetical protein